MVRRFAFAVPGDLATPTGGYAYDRRMIAELERSAGRSMSSISAMAFRWPDASASEAAVARLSAVPAGRIIVIDGLAFGVLPEAARQLRARNPLIALVHHPLALETGLSAQQADAMRASERAALAAAAVSSPPARRPRGCLSAITRVAADRITVARPGTDPVPMAQGSRDGIVRLLVGRRGGAAQGFRRADRGARDARRPAVAAHHRRRSRAAIRQPLRGSMPILRA